MNTRRGLDVIWKQSSQLDIPANKRTTPLILEMKLTSVSSPSITPLETCVNLDRKNSCAHYLSTYLRTYIGTFDAYICASHNTGRAPQWSSKSQLRQSSENLRRRVYNARNRRKSESRKRT